MQVNIFERHHFSKDIVNIISSARKSHIMDIYQFYRNKEHLFIEKGVSRKEFYVFIDTLNAINLVQFVDRKSIKWLHDSHTAMRILLHDFENNKTNDYVYELRTGVFITVSIPSNMTVTEVCDFNKFLMTNVLKANQQNK